MYEVLIDCDDVLSDPTKHLVEILQLRMDVDAPRGFELEEWMPPERVHEGRSLMSTPEFWMSLPQKPGAQEGLQRLRDRGCNITVGTSPYKDCNMWYEARIHWLATEFGIPQDDVMVGKKKFLCGAAHVFIDDYIDNIQKFEQMNPKARAYLFTTPTNLMINRTHRIDWSTIDRIF